MIDLEGVEEEHLLPEEDLLADSPDPRSDKILVEDLHKGHLLQEEIGDKEHLDLSKVRVGIVIKWDI